jgi:hypothetical protein
MTAQIPDTILLQGAEQVLVAWDGTGLFDPYEHGLRPQWSSTDCYRGYTCTYAIGDGSLRLRSVLFHNLGLSGPEEVPTLLGRRGHWSNGYVSYSFPNLEAKILFSGALLAGSGWDKDEWDCIHPAEAFHRVFELTFEEGGRLSGLFDRSTDARELDALPRSWGGKDLELLRAWERKHFAGSYLRPPSPTP